MERREFITGLVALMIASKLSANTKNIKKFDIYIDESGDVGTDQPFVIGALIVDSGYDYKRMERIRETSNYRPTLNYNSSNKYKINLVRPLIDEFFETANLTYSALAFPSKVNKSWPTDKRHRTTLYQHNYFNLLKSINLSSLELNIHMEKRTLTGEDRFLKSSLEKRFDNLKVNFIRDIDSISMQFCDLITGSLYGEMNKTSDKVKVEILNVFASKIKPLKLRESFDFNKGKFSLDVRGRI